MVELLDAGNTVPFITRYRKDQTGGLDEEQIRQIQSALGKMRLLAERKQTILRSIDAQGKLTPELAAEIEAANSTKRLEDLYLPFKPKKQTLATVARERKLEPLAEEILSGAVRPPISTVARQDFVDPDQRVATAADALLGRRPHPGRRLQRAGRVAAAAATNRQTHRQAGQRKDRDRREARPRTFATISNIKSSSARCRRTACWRSIAAKRPRCCASRSRPTLDELQRTADELLVPAEHPHADFLRGCGRDALARLVFPSLEREVRRELTDWAEAHAVEVFARNLRNLLLQPPVRGRRVLAVDPGFKSGCKLAALDEFGNLLDHAVIHLIGKAEKKAEARAKLVELIKTHSVSVAAIGNGTACRETEEVLAELLAERIQGRRAWPT